MATSDRQHLSSQTSASSWWGPLIIFLLIFAVVNVLSARGMSAVPQGANISTIAKARLYSSVFIFEWLLFLFSWRALSRMGDSPALVIALPGTLKRFAVELAVGLGALVSWAVLGALLSKVLHLGTTNYTALLPHGLAQKAMWVCLSVSAGICEEFTFRGYLQTALSKKLGAVLAAVLQGLLFGLAHIYQGPRNAVLIMALGTLWGFFTLWRKSLFPTMFAHIATDVAVVFQI